MKAFQAPQLEKGCDFRATGPRLLLTSPDQRLGTGFVLAYGFICRAKQQPLYVRMRRHTSAEKGSFRNI